MNRKHFSSVSKASPFRIGGSLCLTFTELKELTRGVPGIAAVDRLYPLKPKNPI
ncbi:hypothetical protein ACPUEN_07390 [Algoriphagus yeomjeoni]|uniref:hypothetical protein n=1 Tax=Algoriphagus yeomjeoni TaxID=291403 RepID=UPI003CE54A13